MALPLDESRPVREGERLDLDRLRAFLESEGLGGDVSVEQFPRGYSNLTYLVRVDGRELVLRRPPFGAAAKGGHDMGREFRVLGHLHPVYPKAPRPVAFCGDESVLGAPFYLMERVRGVILRSSLPEALDPGPDGFRALSGSLVDGLVELHTLDVRAGGLLELGRPEGYIERQVRGWTERWEKARTDEVLSIAHVIAWLDARRPPEGPPAVIHNDYKYDNVVLSPADPTRIVAVLDWEMATVGDPLLDLGTTLAYWSDPDDPEPWRRASLSDLTRRPGSLSRVEVAERWSQGTGRPLDHLVFAYAFGLFKVAVIAQQIYARFLAGKTRDPRFAALGAVVQACGAVAEAAVNRGRIDGLDGSIA